MKKKQLLYESLCLYQQKRNVFYFVGVRCFWMYKLKIRKQYLNVSRYHGNPVWFRACFEPSTNTAYISISLKVIVFILQLIPLIVCALKD